MPERARSRPLSARRGGNGSGADVHDVARPEPMDDVIIPSSEGEIDAAVIYEPVDEVEQVSADGAVSAVTSVPPKRKRKLGFFFYLCVFWLALLVFMAAAAS